MSLNKYRQNIYSQNGEDGIIQEIKKRLNLDKQNSNWCVNSELGMAFI